MNIRILFSISKLFIVYLALNCTWIKYVADFRIGSVESRLFIYFFYCWGVYNIGYDILSPNELKEGFHFHIYWWGIQSITINSKAKIYSSVSTRCEGWQVKFFSSLKPLILLFATLRRNSRQKWIFEKNQSEEAFSCTISIIVITNNVY